MNRPTVLVTGAGSLLGQGILRCLHMDGRARRIITADPDPRAPGHWLGERAYVTGLARDEDFLPRLEAVIAAERPDVLLVGTDVELPILSRHRERLKAEFNVETIVSPPQVVDIADDKWLTAEFLRTHGLPFPRSATADDAESVADLVASVGFPLIVKPRIGARAIGFEVVQERLRLEELCTTRPELVVQEALPDQPGEYTAGCIVTDGRCRAVVNLRRDLRDGNTYRAYADTSGRFDGRLAAIAESLGADGPVNLQYRVRDGEPVVFEINARFSGTTPLRAALGFNEVAAMIDHVLDGAPIHQPEIQNAVVLRTWSEMVVQPGDLQRLSEDGRLDQPAGAVVSFKPTPQGGNNAQRRAA